MQVNVLDIKPRNYLMPVSADWYPIYINEKLFKEIGIFFKFFEKEKKDLLDCDVLCISSRHYNLQQLKHREKEAVLKKISEMRSRVSRLIWFDFRDSSGNTQFEVMPYVDKYLKKTVLKNVSKYGEVYYGNRLYTDYIHKRYGIEDDYEEKCDVLNPVYKDKIDVSWNPGLLDFRGGSKGQISKQIMLDKLSRRVKQRPWMNWQAVEKNRKYRMLATFNKKYGRRTIAWQRKHAETILKKLKNKAIITRVKNLREEIMIRNDSEIILSLFGWGELCSRDFQTFIAGAALIAPDTSHIRTWPKTHIKYMTYWPISWSLDDLEQTCSDLLSKSKERLQIAEAGQLRYREIWSNSYRQKFCYRLKRLLKQG